MKLRFSNNNNFAVEFEAFDASTLRVEITSALIRFERERPNAYAGGICELHVYEPMGDVFAWQPVSRGLEWRGERRTDRRTLNIPATVDYLAVWLESVAVKSAQHSFELAIQGLIGDVMRDVDDHLVLSSDELTDVLDGEILHARGDEP